MDVMFHMDVVRTRGQCPTPPPRAHCAGGNKPRNRRCVLDGGEIGSTDHGNRRIRLGCDPVRNAKLVNDNDNFVMETRLAA